VARGRLCRANQPGESGCQWHQQVAHNPKTNNTLACTLHVVEESRTRKRGDSEGVGDAPERLQGPRATSLLQCGTSDNLELLSLTPSQTAKSPTGTEDGVTVSRRLGVARGGEHDTVCCGWAWSLRATGHRCHQHPLHWHTEINQHDIHTREVGKVLGDHNELLLPVPLLVLALLVCPAISYCLQVGACLPIRTTPLQVPSERMSTLPSCHAFLTPNHTHSNTNTQLKRPGDQWCWSSTAQAGDAPYATRHISPTWTSR
jgi:hypothetical protein